MADVTSARRVVFSFNIGPVQGPMPCKTQILQMPRTQDASIPKPKPTSAVDASCAQGAPREAQEGYNTTALQ